jgi:chorismate lyase/3-hydroxybenzoate synthase
MSVPVHSKTTIGSAAVEGVTTPRLEIRIDEKCTPPTQGYNLLLGFQFGCRPEKHDHPAVTCLQLKPLNHHQLTEAWWYEGDVTYTQVGSVRIAECLEYTVAIIQKSSTDISEIRSHTRQAYNELVTAVRSTKHSKLVKIWNYFDEINNGDGDSEKYRQFSVGRAEAFQDMDIGDEDAPTGTAIGTQGGGLTLVAIASNHEYCAVENPRQTSAFHYPRIYGPKSPKFSRGGFVSSESHQLFLISGTAAVVGHESNFPYDTRLQTEETFKNLAHLCDAISEMDSAETKFALDEQSVLRVYIKNPNDYQWISQQLSSKMNVSENNLAYLQGTICRRELTVEIDGVKVA